MSIEMLDEPDTTALTVQHRAAMALNSTKTESDLRALAVKNAHIQQVVDKAGRQQAHGAAMELKTARTDIEKLSKSTREDAVQFGKACIAEEKRLIAIIQPEETRLLGIRDDFDQVQERIKREEEARERARITAIHERIAEIRNFSTLAAQCRTSFRIQELLDKLMGMELISFEEFEDEATAVHLATVSGVKFMLEEKQSEEIERAHAKAEAEALAAQLAADRIEQAKAAAALAADRAILEKERAELAAAKVQQAAIQMRDERAEREAKELAAYQAAINAAPVVDAEIVPVEMVNVMGMTVERSIVEDTQFFKQHIALKTEPEKTRPTDVEIIEVLAAHFRVHIGHVVEWLADMDPQAVEAHFNAEYA